MILSFHPIIEADKNMICAGHPPDAGHLRAIRRSEAVILPQGCPEALYRMAKSNCPHIFPNLDARFDYPGKSGQIRLFRKWQLAHPKSLLVDGFEDFNPQIVPFPLPWVLKSNWGGQGEGVWLVDSPGTLRQTLDRLYAWEKSGQSGFLIQNRIDDGGRSLRVTMIGDHAVSYWRVYSVGQAFGTGVAHGAVIDDRTDPVLRLTAEAVTRQFCRNTHIQLAGFDYLFSEQALRSGRIIPLALEINYFFGRTGLGGSRNYYQLLEDAVDRWLAGLGLFRKKHFARNG